MHRHCLSCSAELGSNEIVEGLPIGRRLAFDAWKGRVWIVCPRCRRWNLMPIEERWEPVEALDRLFRDCRTRVQAENIGVARLKDGTALVRIGQALPGELAAWRYGDELLRRRRTHAALALGSVAAISFAGAVPWLAIAGVPGLGASLLMSVPGQIRRYRLRRRPVHVEAAPAPAGARLIVRQADLDRAFLAWTDEGGLTLQVRASVDRARGWLPAIGRAPVQLALHGHAAERVASRAVLASNPTGATRAQVGEAVALLDASGSAAAFIERVARTRAPLFAWRFSEVPHTGGDIARYFGSGLRGQPPYEPRGYRRLDRIGMLALEMALHEEKERRALEGELAQLEEEWREAEMLAAIADRLPERDARQGRGQ